MRVDDRRRDVRATPPDVWRVIEGIGGRNGWYSVPLVWPLRGLLDRLVGGVGWRRGRPDRLAVGDQLDWWRVEEIVPGARLRLRAEMRLPGTAWLELSVEQRAGQAAYRQRLSFQARGLLGRGYWLCSAPLHPLVFGTMARRVAAEAERGV